MLLVVPRRVTVQLLKSSLINLIFASKGLSTNPSIQEHSLVGFFETTETQRNKNPTACFRCPVKMLCKYVKNTIINIYDILYAHYIESFHAYLGILHIYIYIHTPDIALEFGFCPINLVVPLLMLYSHHTFLVCRGRFKEKKVRGKENKKKTAHAKELP